QIRLENVHVDFKPEPRPVRYGYESLVEDRAAGFIGPFYTVEEGLVVGLMILDGQELVAGGRRMCAGKERYGAVVIVDAGCHTVSGSQVDQFLGFENAAEIGEIRMRDGDCLLLKEVLEAFAEVNVLAGADRRSAGFLKSSELVRVEPRNHILVPGEVVLIQSPCELDEGFNGHVAVVVRGNRNLPAHNAAHGGDILLKPI